VTSSTLSRAADHAVLWMGVAGLMGALGDRRARRAAVTGLAAVAFTSALVNVPLKLVWRRDRPQPLAEILPAVPRPTSFSFPSGHTASAFAFVSAAGALLPPLRIPLGTLAAAVGWSRVYTRVHYPGDVLAGAAIGLAVGTLTRRLAATVFPVDESSR
jgi:undecaprenyl-diphosphatase